MNDKITIAQQLRAADLEYMEARSKIASMVCSTGEKQDRLRWARDDLKTRKAVINRELLK